MKLNLLFLIICFFVITVTNLYSTENFNKTLATEDSYVYDQEISQDSMEDSKFMNDLSEGPVRKLGRGFSNVIFGVCEVPLQVYQTNMAEGGIAACSYGIFKGLTYFIARVGVGVLEIITFPIPLPGAAKGKYATGWGYGPLMQPEWIFTFETNPYDTIYPNYPAH